MIKERKPKTIRRPARVTLILDRDIFFFDKALKKLKFKVLKPAPDAGDDNIKNLAGCGTALLTARPGVFIEDAESFDYDIISLAKIKFSRSDTASAAARIQSALRGSGLPSLKGNLMLTLHSGGRWRLQDLGTGGWLSTVSQDNWIPYD